MYFIPARLAVPDELVGVEHAGIERLVEVVVHLAGHGRLEPVEPETVLADFEQLGAGAGIVAQVLARIVVELLAPTDLAGGTR